MRPELVETTTRAAGRRRATRRTASTTASVTGWTQPARPWVGPEAAGFIAAGALRSSRASASAAIRLMVATDSTG